MTANLKKSVFMLLLAALPFVYTACNDSSNSPDLNTKSDGSLTDSPCQGPQGPCGGDGDCCGAGSCDFSQQGAAGGGQCNALSYLQNGQSCSTSNPSAMCFPGSFCNSGTCG